MGIQEKNYNEVDNMGIQEENDNEVDNIFKEYYKNFHTWERKSKCKTINC